MSDFATIAITAVVTVGATLASRKIWDRYLSENSRVPAKLCEQYRKEITAVTGTGYAEVSVARNAVDWTYGTDAGDAKVTSKDCVFTASGADWTTAKKLVIEAILNAVDTLIGYSDLSQDRTVGNGESLTASLKMKLS